MATLTLDDVELVVEAHKLQPGDVFAIRLPIGYEAGPIRRWEEVLRQKMPDGITLMFLPPGYDIEVYRVGDS